MDNSYKKYNSYKRRRLTPVEQRWRHKETVEVLADLKQHNIKIDTLYNFGVGHWPHQEALQWKKRRPDVEIYGVEPNPITYFDRINDYPGNLYQIGVWSENSVQELNMSRDFGHSSFLKQEEEWIKRVKTKGTHDSSVIIDDRVSVLCQTIDSLDNFFGNPDNIFIWMDIEGAELKALKGARALLESGRVKGLFLESATEKINRRVGEPKLPDLNRFLYNYGFSHKKYNTHPVFENILYLKKQ